ncbi:MAG: lipopolysaccharide heptosyltransferase II [Gammaproteobacteria bacterium]|nr:lipopolysaccharide heptosyltransferase II [Gammaproteobacteria bacterium]
MSDANSILIVGPSWVGDMVMAQSLFMLLRKRHPGAALDVLAPAWSLPIVARMPEIRRGYASGTGHGRMNLLRRWRIAAELRGNNYDSAVVLPRSFKAAVIPWLANIPKRTGFRGEFRYGLINDVREFQAAVLDQTVKRFAALALEPAEPLPRLPNPALQVCAARQQQLLGELDLEVGRKAVAFLPGAEYGPAKCWPAEKFARLASLLDDKGYAVWVMGSAKERALGETIAAGSAAINLCGKTQLADVVDLLALCEHAISNDSGLMHVAAAAGVHVQAIYGSSSPRFTPPLTDNKTIHYLDLECSPCFKRKCPLQHLNCLQGIDPERVAKRLT